MAAEWYYDKGQEQIGPLTAAQLKQLVRSGELTRNDMVWKEGMPKWMPVEQVKGLYDAGASGGSRTTEPLNGADGKPAPAVGNSAGASVLADGVASAGRMIDQVGRFGAQLHNISSTMFESGEGRDDHPAIFVRGKYFGGRIQKGLPPSMLNSLGSTLLAVLFSWLYIGLILYLMGAAWQFLPFHRTEFLSVRLRRRVRSTVIMPAIITWAVQMFAVYSLLFLGSLIAMAVVAALDARGMLPLIMAGSGALWIGWYAICNYTALKLIRGLNPDDMFDFQASLEYGYPRKVALIRGISGAPMEQQLEGVLALCEQLGNVEFGRWDQVTAHGKEGVLGGIWSRVQNLAS